MPSVSSLSKYQYLVLGNTKTRIYEFLLRIGASGTFLGHGMLALNVNPKWISLITVYGFQDTTAQHLLPIIGCMDIVMTLALLLYPIRALIIWAVIWPFAASLSYMIAGEPAWEFVERISNWILPLALLWLMGFPKKWNELWVR